MQQCSFTRILSNFFAPLIVPSRVTQSTPLKKKKVEIEFQKLETENIEK